MEIYKGGVREINRRDKTVKTVNINVDLEGIDLAAEIKDLPTTEIVMNVLRSVILNFGSTKRGLDEKDRRIYYKICDVFDEAKKSKSEEIELEDEWFGFIKKCFKETPLMPDKLLRRVEEAVGAVKDR